MDPLMPLWLLLAAAGLILIAVLAGALYTRYAARRIRFIIGPEGLRIRGRLRSIRLPRHEIVIEQARFLEGPDDRGFAPAYKMGGFGTISLTIGWWRLENKQRALVYIRAGTRRVYIPTTRGYTLILTPTEPERFLQDLKQGVQEEHVFCLAGQRSKPGPSFPLAFDSKKSENEEG